MRALIPQGSAGSLNHSGILNNLVTLKNCESLKEISEMACVESARSSRGQSMVKFPHRPILHYAFSSWIEKTMTKTIHCLGKTDLFYNRMGLCGNFTQKKPCLRRLQKKKFIF